jgi:hypothetical protein
MALPISVVWSVRVGLGRKILLGGIFSLVVITMTFAIVRVTVVSEGYTTTQQGGRQQAEITWLYFWSFIEFAVGMCSLSHIYARVLIHVAVIVASLASFRALFVKKNRDSEAEEVHKREMLQREAPSSKSKAVWARAKYFQQSLLETMKTESTVMERRTTNDSNLPLQPVCLVEHGLLDDGHSTQKSVRSLESV